MRARAPERTDIERVRWKHGFEDRNLKIDIVVEQRNGSILIDGTG
jgi:hypothetical protein